MENRVVKSEPRQASPEMLGIAGVMALALGAALLGVSLYMLPAEPAYGFPWALAGAVTAFVAIAAGGWCLTALLRRPGDGAYRYGQDGTDGTVQLGIFAIIAGVLLLCFNFGALPMVWRSVFFSWQMLIVVIAAGELARGRFVGGIVCLAVGAFFIIRRLAPIYPDIAASGAGITFWPVLLVIGGVLILCKIIFRPCRGGCCRQHRDNAEFGKRCGESVNVSGIVDISAVFGGSEQVYLDPVFGGGKIAVVFGGVKLDLRRTNLPEGVTYLRIESVFGGVEIDTPEEWPIEIVSESIFGGFTDKRLPALGKRYDDGRKLVIRVSNAFGGGEIK